MKKSILTLSLVALFSVAANAQDTKKAPRSQEPTKAQTVNDDGTSTAPASINTAEKKQETPVKKSGTRMAINEKGTSGGIKPKSSSKNEEKKSESPAGQPGSGKKD